MLPIKKSLKRLTRRDFLKLGEPLSIGLLLSACGIKHSQKESKPSATTLPLPTDTPAATPTMECIDPSSISQFSSIEGQHYEALVPDTLDLQVNAELAINALTRTTQPDLYYDIYFYGTAARNPPVMYRLMGLYAKFWESLSLMRYMTGSSFNTIVDQRWRQIFWQMFQSNSLGFSFTDARLLCWAANNFQQENNPCWRDITEEAVNRLSNTYIHEKDYCYYKNDAGSMRTGWEATFEGWSLQGVTRVYAITGSLSARILAYKLARYLKNHAQVFDSDGRFLARHESDMGPALHFHHNGNAMSALAEFALATGDPEFITFAIKGYEYARSVGWPLVGFFPEYVEDWPDPRPYIDSETCCVADMIIMGISLSKTGLVDYWDDVDRYVRNQFTEMQMKSGDWIDNISEKYPVTPIGTDEDGDQVSERVVGSFSGWAAVNDYCINEEENIISACCTGNGARAIYYAWESILEHTQGQLRVNLLLNRASPWADVNSYIPFEGKVEVQIKEASDLQIRLPEWVKNEEATITVNGVSQDIAIQNRYASVGYVDVGDLVTLSFPIAERTVETSIGGANYKLAIKGNDVVSIDPPGKYQPFYQREKYRGSQTRWVQRERFIPAT